MPDNQMTSKMPVQIAAGRDEAGAYFVSITHSYPLASFQWAIPIDQADAFADGFAEGIKEAAAAARREASGIVIAQPGMNGHLGPGGQPRRR